MKFFHISDLHFGLNKDHDELVLKNLDHIIQKAKDEGISFIVIAGDLFNSNNISTQNASKLFDRLLETDISFVLIPGGGSQIDGETQGHDAYTENSIYKDIEIKKRYLSESNIYLLTPENNKKILEIDGKKIEFIAGFFNDLPSIENLKKNKGSDYRIGIFHGSYRNNKYENKYEEDISHLENHFDYIALGHYHTYKKVLENACYSGAFIQFEFIKGKNAESGYLFIDLESFSIKFEKLSNAPEYITTSVLSEKDLKNLNEFLKDSNKIVKVSMYLKEFEKDIEKLLSFKRLTVQREGRIDKEYFESNIKAIESIIKEHVEESLTEEILSLFLYVLSRDRLRKSDIERYIRGNLLGE